MSQNNLYNARAKYNKCLIILCATESVQSLIHYWQHLLMRLFAYCKKYIIKHEQSLNKADALINS